MADENQDDTFEGESDEADLPLEEVVAGLRCRVAQLERDVQTLLDVVKPYRSRWWSDWSWHDFFGVGAVLLGPLALAWAVSSNPQLALPVLMGIAIVGVVAFGWILYIVVGGLLSKERERRHRALFLFAMLLLCLGLQGLIPVSYASPTWQMPLWLSVLLIAVGGLSLFRLSAKD